MKKRWIALVIVALLGLPGCQLLASPTEVREPGGMVEQIDVIDLPVQGQEKWVFREPEKISAILAYLQGLHVLEEDGTISDFIGDATRQIVVRYQFGGKKNYYLMEDRYLRLEQEEWKPLESEPVPSLDEILQQNHSDI